MLMIFTASISLDGKIKEPAENVLPAGFLRSGHQVSCLFIDALGENQIGYKRFIKTC